MSNEDKRTSIKRWFWTPCPLFPVGAIVMGSIFIVIGILVLIPDSGDGTRIITFAILLLLGIIDIIFIPFDKSLNADYGKIFNLNSYNKAKERFEIRPTQSQMKIWLKEDIQSIIPTAMNQVGFNEKELVREPIYLYGPVWWDVSGETKYKVRRRDLGERNYLYGTYYITIINFSENSIAVYSTYYNWIEHTIINSKTEEYYYKDIVSVKTETDSIAFKEENKSLQKSRTFRISVSSGEYYKVLIDDPVLMLDNREELISLGDQAVNVIRQMLRDKKV